MVLTLAFLECGIAVLVHVRDLDIRKPTYTWANIKSEFWTDRDAVFGVWHAPNDRYRHAKSCFDVVYETNSHGARDRDRSFEIQGSKRVVVLGDSFVEGYGVAREDRFTDRLEASLGVEFLNFGTSGNFGPTQYMLLYRSLAKRFEHNTVIVGLLPANDFRDDDYRLAKEVFADRYRPYLVGSSPDFEIIYHQDHLPAETAPIVLRKPLTVMLREYTYTYNAYKYVRLVQRFRRESHDKQAYSGYYDYDGVQIERLKHVLRMLVEEAGDRPVLVAVFPTLPDLYRFSSEGEPPLTAALEPYVESLGAHYLDLLPLMHARPEDPTTFFLNCNGHWAAEAHALAADFIAPIAEALSETEMGDESPGQM
jgi:hypothetical protein